MKKTTFPLVAGFFLIGAVSLQGVLLVSEVYDEQQTKANSVNFEMGYSGNTTWTTGIGQTLGAAQIITLDTFKTMVTEAYAAGLGGVVTFDGVDAADYNQVQSFDISFAGGAKQLTLSNRIGGNYSIAGPSGNRTAISGSQYLGTGGNAHFDFDFIDFIGTGPNEKIVAVGVTILGRDDTGTGRNYRVIARYTDGVDTGSTSTFRSFDMENGNGTQDSFSGILAPEGYWITSMRVHSDNNIFTSIDDFGFVLIPEPSTYALVFGGLVLGGALALRCLRRKRRS